MATTTTTNLSLTLAVPGSNEPFDTNDVNANFEAIDAEVGLQRAADTSQNTRLTTIEKFTNPAASTPTIGVIPSGTTAQRDGFWGIPADAAARVALANKIARWWNTEKGYEEQYFAQFDDAGIGTLTPAKDVGKWAPANDRTPLTNYTISNVTGTTKKYGNTVELTAVNTLRFENIFNDDFDKYEFDVLFSGASADSDFQMRLRTGGVDDVGASAYGLNRLEVGAGSTIVNTYTNGSLWIGCRVATNGSHGKILISGPNLPRRTLMQVDNGDAAGYQRRLTGVHGTLTEYESISFIVATSATVTGKVRVFGLSS